MPVFKASVYTIGPSNHAIEKFLGLLQRFEIEAVVLGGGGRKDFQASERAR